MSSTSQAETTPANQATTAQAQAQAQAQGQPRATPAGAPSLFGKRPAANDPRPRSATHEHAGSNAQAPQHQPQSATPSPSQQPESRQADRITARNLDAFWDEFEQLATRHGLRLVSAADKAPAAAPVQTTGEDDPASRSSPVAGQTCTSLEEADADERTLSCGTGAVRQETGEAR